MAKVFDPCLRTLNVGGVCPDCGQVLEPAHVTEDGGLRVSCGECCPICRAGSFEWSSPAPAAIEGIQESLFE